MSNRKELIGQLKYRIDQALQADGKASSGIVDAIDETAWLLWGWNWNDDAEEAWKKQKYLSPHEKVNGFTAFEHISDGRIVGMRSAFNVPFVSQSIDLSLEMSVRAISRGEGMELLMLAASTATHPWQVPLLLLRQLCEMVSRGHA